jgi:peptide chain release factor subunit 1
MIETDRARSQGRELDSRRARRQAAALLRHLAEREPTALPVLSAYLDLRPPADTTVPGVREARIVLRDRLAEAITSLPAHSDAHRSIAIDRERTAVLLDDVAAERHRGLAVFACAGEGLFEQLRSWSAFDSRVEVGPAPFLVPLARLVDHEPALVAVADTNTLRLFLATPSRLDELPAIDDEPDDYTRTEVGGWAQARYQRHVNEHRDAFARRAADRIQGTMELEGAQSLLLAGDDVAIPRLRHELSTAVAVRVRDVLRIELRASRDEIEAKVLPVAERLRTDDAHDAADRLVGAVRAKGLGVGRAAPVRRALEAGQGLELLLDPAGPPAEADGNEFVRLAARSGTRIRFVPDHDGLRELGGVGLLLRYLG